MGTKTWERLIADGVSFQEQGVYQIVRLAKLAELASSGEPFQLFHGQFSGFVDDEKPLCFKLEDLGFRLIYRNESFPATLDEEVEVKYPQDENEDEDELADLDEEGTYEEGIVEIYLGECGILNYSMALHTGVVSVSWSWEVSDEQVHKSLGQLAKTMRSRLPKVERREAPLGLLVSDIHGISIKRFHGIAAQLERDNYGEDVLFAYDAAIDDLHCKTPNGRLILMEGKPGTGKTWMIRGMMYDASHANFLHTKASYIEEFDSPALLGLLIDHRRKNRGPLVLVIEDGDSCLLPRATDNMSQISSLLNYCDGLTAPMLDFRVIATTNAGHLLKRAGGIDEALMRNGRKSAHIKMDKLTNEHAKLIVERLFGGEPQDFQVKGGILGDVYEQARNLGWKPPQEDGWQKHELAKQVSRNVRTRVRRRRAPLLKKR